jgi:hypothetical protein
MKEMRNAYTIFVKRTNVEKQRWREGGIIWSDNTAAQHLVSLNKEGHDGRNT